MATHSTFLIERLIGFFREKHSQGADTKRTWMLDASLDDDVEISDEIDLTDKDAMWLEEIRDFISNHIGDERLNASWLAKQKGLSRRHLQRRIKTLTGITPHKFINNLKMDLSIEIIKGGEVLTVGEASRRIGFVKTAYFSRLFKNHHGISPSEVLNNGLDMKLQWSPLERKRGYRILNINES